MGRNQGTHRTMITYFNSKILNLPYKYDSETGIITVKDLKKYGARGYVKYSKSEIEILSELGGITPEIHIVKSVFDGEIVREAKD